MCRWPRSRAAMKSAKIETADIGAPAAQKRWLSSGCTNPKLRATRKCWRARRKQSPNESPVCWPNAAISNLQPPENIMSAAILVLVEHLKGAVADITSKCWAPPANSPRRARPRFTRSCWARAWRRSPRVWAQPTACWSWENPALAQPSSEAVIGVLKQIVAQKQASLVLVAAPTSPSDWARDWPFAPAAFVNFCKDARPKATPSSSPASCSAEDPLRREARRRKGIVSVIRARSRPTRQERSGAPVRNAGGDRRSVEGDVQAIHRADAGDVDITKQSALVAVGRGIQTQDNVQLAEELAQCSAAPCAPRDP